MVTFGLAKTELSARLMVWAAEFMTTDKLHSRLAYGMRPWQILDEGLDASLRADWSVG